MWNLISGGYDILEVETLIIYFLGMTDFRVSWPEQHEIILKKVIELSYFTIEWQP